MDFARGVVTPESVWRAIILYGANSATYKFAYGRALLELAAERDTETLALAEIAPRYAELLCEALAREPRQGTSTSSRFLDACRSYNVGTMPLDELHAATERLGFSNVVDAFPQLMGSAAPITFYEDRRKDPAVRGLVISPDLRALAQAQAPLLDSEAAARWRLVETAWSAGVTAGLISPVIGVDLDQQVLTIGQEVRRRSVAGIPQAFSGYQDGRCAYCQGSMAELGGPVVEHVLPFVLKERGWAGPDVDAVWNLVLACAGCNGRKLGRAPDPSWMDWLERRNNDLIVSNHPLRQTLMWQTGETPAERHDFLVAAYLAATEALPATWTPPFPVGSFVAMGGWESGGG